MATSSELRRYTLLGIGLMFAGAGTALIGALFAHFTGAPVENSLGEEIYTAFPRGWLLETAGQIVSVTGFFMILAGIVVGFVYNRQMTWARASLSAFAFVSASIILFGVIPNQWLTIAQTELQLDGRPLITSMGCPPDQSLFCLSFPSGLVGGNAVAFSYAALKDAVSGTYAVVALGAVVVGMVKTQDWIKKQKDAPPPAPVSEYGRPMSIAERT